MKSVEPAHLPLLTRYRVNAWPFGLVAVVSVIVQDALVVTPVVELTEKL